MDCSKIPLSPLRSHCPSWISLCQWDSMNSAGIPLSQLDPIKIPLSPTESRYPNGIPFPNGKRAGLEVSLKIVELRDGRVGKVFKDDRTIGWLETSLKNKGASC